MAIILVRTVFIYFMVILSMRLMGKRQLGELEPAEFVVAVIISDLAANPLQDIGIPLFNGILPIVILVCCEIILSALLVKSVFLRKLFCGLPCALVVGGRIDRRQMRRNRLTLDELMEQLRSQGITDLRTVQHAILETDGKLSLILTPGERPVTAGQMGVTAPNTGYPIIVVNDGRVLPDNLEAAGRDMNWLNGQLSMRGLKDTKEVYLLTVDSLGGVYFAAKGVSGS